MPRSVPSGDLEFRIRNEGTRDHSMKIVGGGLEVESATIEPGEAGTLKVSLTPNRFDAFCAVGDHTSKERGEVGVTVTASPPQ